MISTASVAAELFYVWRLGETVCIVFGRGCSGLVIEEHGLAGGCANFGTRLNMDAETSDCEVGECKTGLGVTSV